MRTLVFADVHCRYEIVEKVITQETFDKVILLGDYFDTRPVNKPLANAATAKWIKSRIHDPKWVFLYGNHDPAYAYWNRKLLTNCYSLDSDMLINEILNYDDWNNFKFYYIHEGWLFTHAGLHPDFISTDVNNLDLLNKYLHSESNICSATIGNDGSDHWFYRAGDARMLNPTGVGVGGILWCDRDKEFVGTDWLPQMFGHTPSKTYPVWLRGDTGLERICSPKVIELKHHAQDGWNLALDTFSRHYAVIENGVAEVKEIKINKNENPNN